MAVALLVPFAPSGPPPPRASVLGRGAVQLAQEGVEVVFCQPARIRLRKDGQLEAAGVAVDQDGWAAAVRPVQAGYLRVAKQADLEELASLRDRFRRAGRALGNPAALVSLCRDKHAFAVVAERRGLPFAPCAIASNVMAAVESWRCAYIKPRWGARGRDVACVSRLADGFRVEDDHGDRSLDRVALAHWLREREEQEPQLLQRAVSLAPGPWRSISVRSLVQRAEDGRWITTTPVVRQSRDAIAGNVSMGASVCTLAELERELGWVDGSLMTQVRALDAAVVAAIDAELGDWAAQCVELGIDYVPDAEGRLVGIEVNDTPQGRLEVLAERGHAERAEHMRAVTRPFRYLCSKTPGLLDSCAALALG